MPTLRGPLRIIEFLGGKGLASNTNPHDVDDETFSVYTDLINDSTGRRRKRFGTSLMTGTTAAEVKSLFYYYTGVFHLLLRTFSTNIQYMLAPSSSSPSSWISVSKPTGFTVTHADWAWCLYNNQVYGCNGTDKMIRIDTAEAWEVGCDAPATAMGYSLSTADVAYSTGTVQCTKGNRNIVGTGTAWTSAYNGKPIDINGFRYIIDSVSSGTNLSLTTEFKEATASGIVYTIWPGLMDWELPPKYCYAYYNPTTGHVSNRSPVTELTEQNVSGRTVYLDAIAYSSAAFLNGFTKIIIFRTPRNGNTLVKVTEINNVNSAGTTNWTETSSTYLDKHLSNLEAPLILNRKPPAGMYGVVAAGGRLWAFSKTDGKLYFTPTAEECPFGRPEECWPAKNSRSLPAWPTGLLVVNDPGGQQYVVVQTTQGEYTVAGYDNLTFYIAPMPTRGRGGWQGSAISVNGTFVSFSGDRRLIFGDTDIGVPIQDKLNGLNASVRLAWFQSKRFSYLVVAGGAATYVFDLDQQCWYQWNIALTCLAEVYTGEWELWAGMSDRVSRLFDENTYRDGLTDLTPVMTTQWIRPFGHGRRAKFKSFKIYANSALAGFLPIVYVNENNAWTNAPDFMSARPAPFQANSKELVYEPTRPIVGYSFKVQLTFPTNSTEIYLDKLVLEFEPDFEDAEATG